MYNNNNNMNININNYIGRVPPSIKLDRKQIKNEQIKEQVKELKNSNVKLLCAKKLFNNY